MSAETKHRRGRGRPPRDVPAVEWKVWIPEDIAALVDLECTDPTTGKIKYGERAKLLEGLLREHYRNKGALA